LTQRVSALLLGPLVLVHIAVPQAPFMGGLGALLLVVVLVHGLSGLWRLAAMKSLSAARQRLAMSISVAMTLALAGLGAIVVASLF
jgi:succinate dehydrogenase hydrophobic anchor subunit